MLCLTFTTVCLLQYLCKYLMVCHEISYRHDEQSMNLPDFDDPLSFYLGLSKRWHIWVKSYNYWVDSHKYSLYNKIWLFIYHHGNVFIDGVKYLRIYYGLPQHFLQAFLVPRSWRILTSAIFWLLILCYREVDMFGFKWNVFL